MPAALSVFLRRALPLAFTLLSFTAQAATWQQPTEEELKMTAQPEVPGAPAVILFHEEVTDDPLGSVTYYTRIKILTTAGRDSYSTVSVKYPTHKGWMPTGGWKDDVAPFTVANVEGRTIHPDGSVIPLTSKPFDKELTTAGEMKIREKVFTLPDVQLGSILEYRYTLRFAGGPLSGRVALLPEWDVQSELFARRQHFAWNTYDLRMRYTSLIPGKPRIDVSEAVNGAGKLYRCSLTIENIMPQRNESYMPPLHSLLQRVVFYDFSGDGIDSADTFWTVQGKEWSRELDRFIGSSSAVKARSAALVSTASTQAAKLRTLYAEVMSLENTDLTRAHSAEEDKAESGRATHEAEDVLTHKRGSADQLTLLFVALARAAGFKAYAMRVTNRDRNVFLPVWLTFDQLDDDIAIVEVDGKERFFDPGARFCPYGQLDWKHTATGGPRQTAKDVEIATTPLDSYEESQTTRIADLSVDAAGRAAGPLTLTWTGAPALALRQRAARTDEAALRTFLEKQLLDLLPHDAQLSLDAIDNLADPEKPLTVHAKIEVNVFAGAGKRRIAPSQLFHSHDAPLFPETSRTIPVYFDYPERIADIVRYKLPAGWHVDTPPAPTNLRFEDMATYKATAQTGSGVVVLRRESILSAVVAFAREYPQLRDFYSKVAISDQQPLIALVQ
jgi:hypothetical protein